MYIYIYLWLCIINYFFLKNKNNLKIYKYLLNKKLYQIFYFIFLFKNGE